MNYSPIVIAASCLVFFFAEMTMLCLHGFRNEPFKRNGESSACLYTFFFTYGGDAINILIIFWPLPLLSFPPALQSQSRLPWRNRPQRLTTMCKSGFSQFFSIFSRVRS
jgi:hypothetical protein